ncbi:helix-turn-helix domain-containing protein [Streptomyces sp. MMG1522]|uniref:helix-turn-helix domain-containing protein n=1 Tax=Streptomyces sp. MMG1522 TaxID=1415545 RepID=UPI001F30C3EC|nr:helix-turn-helix transcriptional regulator [Streptomyces sp. MMG1522]
MRALKARDGKSHEALGRRLSISVSTLHRYCSGATVPEEFAMADRLTPAVRDGRGRTASPGSGLDAGGPRPPPSRLAHAGTDRVGRTGVEPGAARAGTQ